MQKYNYLLISVFVLLFGPNFVMSQAVGVASIHAPAVLLANNKGTLTLINLTVYRGNGIVNVVGPQNIKSNTNQSAHMGAVYATSLLNLNYSHYKFVYHIEDNTSNVSGPSAGAAMTMLAISALSHKKLRNDFTMTGTINLNGSIGQIGGIYDKAEAAHIKGMKFILVPRVMNGSFENQIYFLTQREFSIPLVQVSNISQAEHFAFGTNNMSNNGTEYRIYVDYHINTLPNASLSCSNFCNVSTFKGLQKFTINLSESVANQLIAEPKFADIGTRFMDINSEAKTIAAKGYLYIAADIEFLNYVNASLFLNHNITINAGLSKLDDISTYCFGLNSPVLTDTNYEYVIGGQLRNGWGSYTMNMINAVNKSKLDTDVMLTLLKTGGEVNAWCRAANFMYTQSKKMGGYPVTYTNTLKIMAKNRIKRVSDYHSMYLSTAEKFYSMKEYGAAILDADYAYTFNKVLKYQNDSTTKLNTLAKSISANSTYGIWATQFANEAMFYVYQSSMGRNKSTAHTQALNAYQSAVLASQISNDTANIYNNLMKTASSTSTVPPTTSITLPSHASTTYYSSETIDYFAITFSIAAIVISIIAAVIASLAYVDSKKKLKKPKRINRRR